MKVRCVTNRQSALGPEFGAASLPPGQVLFFAEDLTVGEVYIVYAITLRTGNFWYYLCGNRGVAVPYWFPEPLFEIIDDRLSTHWIFRYWHRRPDGREADYPIFAFPEWARDLFFYDRLTDGDEEALETFGRYRILMDEEAEGSR